MLINSVFFSVFRTIFEYYDVSYRIMEYCCSDILPEFLSVIDLKFFIVIVSIIFFELHKESNTVFELIFINKDTVFS